MDFTSWIDKLTREGAVISGAPVMFWSTVFVVAIAIWVIIHFMYRHTMKMQEDRLKWKEDRIGTIEQELKALSASREMPERTLSVRHTSEKTSKVQPALQQIPDNPFKAIDRELVPISPKDLTGLYEGRTSSEGQRLASPYMEKLMRINGKVQDVHTNDSYGCVTLEMESNGVFMTELRFETKWNDRLSTIRKGDKIQVIGLISSVSSATLRLQRCEMVNS